jgi:small-conductance mechanosensitive channel
MWKITTTKTCNICGGSEDVVEYDPDLNNDDDDDDEIYFFTMICRNPECHVKFVSNLYGYGVRYDIASSSSPQSSMTIDKSFKYEDVCVKRSDGKIENGWKVLPPPYAHFYHVWNNTTTNNKAEFRVMVVLERERYEKYIRVSEFLKTNPTLSITIFVSKYHFDNLTHNSKVRTSADRMFLEACETNKDIVKFYDPVAKLTALVEKIFQRQV